jgi:hypothetical protein
MVKNILDAQQKNCRELEDRSKGLAIGTMGMRNLERTLPVKPQNEHAL